MQLTVAPEPFRPGAESTSVRVEPFEAEELSLAALQRSTQLPQALSVLRAEHPLADKFLVRLNEFTVGRIFVLREPRILEVKNPLVRFEDKAMAVLHIL